MQKTIAAVVAVLLAITALLVLNPPSAAACSCAEPPPASEAVNTAQLVFVAHQVDRYEAQIGDSWNRHRLVMQVTEVYKGDVPATFELTTGGGDADCGIDFSGRGPIGFAVTSDGDGRAYVGLCDGSFAAGDIRALYDEARPPVTTTIDVPFGGSGGGDNNQVQLIALAVVAAGLVGAAGLATMRRRQA